MWTVPPPEARRVHSLLKAAQSLEKLSSFGPALLRLNCKYQSYLSQQPPERARPGSVADRTVPPLWLCGASTHTPALLYS